jgi:transcriptional regulator with XRE-family HTH domain
MGKTLTIARARSNQDPRIFVRKFMLLQRGMSISDLARRLKVSVPFASMLIAGKKRCQEKESAICRILRVRREVLWQ